MILIIIIILRYVFLPPEPTSFAERYILKSFFLKEPLKLKPGSYRSISLIQESVINILVGVKTIRLTRDFVNLPTTRGLLVIETRGWALDRQWKEATIQNPKFYTTQSTIHTTHKYKQNTLLSWTIGHRQLSPGAGQVSQVCSGHESNVNTLINEKPVTIDLSLPSCHINFFISDIFSSFSLSGRLTLG